MKDEEHPAPMPPACLERKLAAILGRKSLEVPFRCPFEKDLIHPNDTPAGNPPAS
jgi:hypothetical protein